MGPFPDGSYTFTTFLDAVTTKCVSNIDDWKCAPYQTYTDSPSGAMAPFQWIIASTGPESSRFMISSSNNPFAISFANATLALFDAGLESERYTFRTMVEKMVVPSLGINCHYNETMLEASLFTKRPRTYPEQSSASGPTSTGTTSTAKFEEWNYAVEITQSIGGDLLCPNVTK